jgi:hypothetical protein
VRTLLLAAAFALLPGLVLGAARPGAAALAQIESIEGRLVQISVVSIGIVDRTTGKTVHFLLDPHFEEAFAAGGKTPIPMERIRIGNRIRVFFDQKFAGTRRAERIELLK